MKFIVGDGSIAMADGRPAGADLAIEGPAARRGEADTLNKAREGLGAAGACGMRRSFSWVSAVDLLTQHDAASTARGCPPQILFQYNARRQPVNIEELLAASAASVAASGGGGLPSAAAPPLVEGDDTSMMQ